MDGGEVSQQTLTFPRVRPTSILALSLLVVVPLYGALFALFRVSGGRWLVATCFGVAALAVAIHRQRVFITEDVVTVRGLFATTLARADIRAVRCVPYSSSPFSTVEIFADQDRVLRLWWLPRETASALAVWLTRSHLDAAIAGLARGEEVVFQDRPLPPFPWHSLLVFEVMVLVFVSLLGCYRRYPVLMLDFVWLILVVALGLALVWRTWAALSRRPRQGLALRTEGFRRLSDPAPPNVEEGPAMPYRQGPVVRAGWRAYSTISELREDVYNGALHIRLSDGTTIVFDHQLANREVLEALLQRRMYQEKSV